MRKRLWMKLARKREGLTRVDWIDGKAHMHMANGYRQIMRINKANRKLIRKHITKVLQGEVLT